MIDMEHASPEMRLLLLCARSFADGPDAPDQASIQAASSQISDWPSFLLLARNHHLVPMLYKLFSENTSSGVPLDVVPQLQRIFLCIAVFNVRLACKLHEIQQTMMAENITCIPIKGPVLAIQGFGSTSMRQFGDLDLIIPSSHLLRAGVLLSEMGFELDELPEGADLAAHARTLQEWKYMKRDSRVRLDIRPVIASHTLASRTMTDDLLQHTVTIALDGKRTIRAPDPATMLLIVCMNGASEMWKRLSDATDVAALLSSHADADWEGLLARAERWGQKRSMLVGVRVAEELLGFKPQQVFQDALGRDEMARRLAMEAAQRLVSGQSMRPDTVRERLFALRSRTRTRDRCRFLLREVFVPGARELNVIRLPRWLHFAYYLMRPFRLLWNAVRQRKTVPTLVLSEVQ